MNKIKIDMVEVNRMLLAGKKAAQIARELGVHRSAITHARKRLGHGIAKNIALENAHTVVTEIPDVINQLQKVNQDAN
jgi:hypothetical protein